MASSSPLAEGRPLDATRADTDFKETTVDTELDVDAQLEKARLTQNPLIDVRLDEGYLMKGWRRTLRDEGKGMRWYYTQSTPDETDAIFRSDSPGLDTPFIPPDIFVDTQTFPDKETTVQIVEFRKQHKVPAQWYPPLTDPTDIHCEGLHGPTLKAVAEATGWPLGRFSSIFTWARTKMEWADDVLLVHFQNQGTRIFIWQGGGKYPVLITCNTLDPQDSSITHIFDFVDRGCSRPEIILREDPSLLLYGVVRAVIQDLRYSLYDISREMGDAFTRSTRQPSHTSLLFLCYLQRRVFNLNIEIIPLRSVMVKLVTAADRMKNQAEELKTKGKSPDANHLISERTQFMLNEELDLINQSSLELSEFSRETEVIANMAFNTVAFSTNTFLKALAIITLASAPITVATGILGINYFDADHINGRTVAIVISSIGGVVIIGLVGFVVWFVGQRRDRGDDGSNLTVEAKSKQTKGSFPALKQTEGQRANWARAQDLERVNQAVVQRKAQQSPMMRNYPAFTAPSPSSRSTSPLVLHDENAPPRRSRTMMAPLSLSQRRTNRNATTIVSRSPEAAAEEGNSLNDLARQQTDLPSSDVMTPETPPSGGGGQQNASSPLSLPPLQETPSRVSQ